MLDSVRTRLTLWYVGVLALILVTFSFGVYALLAGNLERRTDAGLRAALESMNHLLGFERAEGDSVQAAASNTVSELRYPHVALAIYSEDGRLLAETIAEGDIHARLPVPPSEIDETPRLLIQPDFTTPGRDNLRIFVQRVRALPTDAPNLIVALQSMQSINEELRSLRQVFLIAVPLGLVLAGIGGWFLARKALAPVVSMSDQARRIGASSLGERLQVENPRDELGRLASTFNELLTRLNVAFDQQRQFMTDASHELRTPLSVIHTTAQVTLEGEHRAEAEYRAAIALMDVQTQRLARIVSDMFTLARADAGQRELEPVDFYLDEMVVETVHMAEVLGKPKGVNLRLEPTTEMPFRGDEGLLRQMLLNLLDNAIKHTPPGGEVSVALSRSSGSVEFVVADTGTGIPPEAQAHVFERFYRADKARSRSTNGEANGRTSGAGLGLSIARWVAEAHGGSISLVRSDSTGTTFSIDLPVQS